MRAAIYGRVSSERQEKEHTIGSQLEALRVYAAKNNLQVVEEFTDEGYSGARLDRPALDRMRDLAENRGFEVLLVYCTDRLARKFVLQALILDELEHLGVKTIFLEGGAADDPLSKLVHQITGAVAEFERVKITERYRRGKLYRARCGEVVSSGVPFGYIRIPRQDGIAPHVVIDEDAASVVRRVYCSYVQQGQTIRQIAKELTLARVPTPRGGRQWNCSTVAFMLRDEAYVGTLYYNRKKCVPVENARGHKGQRYVSTLRPHEEWIPITVPPIVDVVTFQAAARRVEQNRSFSRRNLRHSEWYLLRYLVRCGHCDVSCSAVTPGRGDYGYYACWHKSRGFLPEQRCHQRHVRADLLDEMVWREVRARLKDPALILEGFREHNGARMPGDEAKETRERVDAQIKSARMEISRLLDAYQGAAINLAEFQERRRLVDSKLDMLKREAVVLDKIAAERKNDTDLGTSLEQFSSLVSANLMRTTFEDKQKILRMVLDKVVVKDHQVDVHYKIPLPERTHPPDTRVSTQFDLRPTRHFLFS